ncbi:MAG TPA: hypothetical protein VLA79_07810, partial [Polyangia bacterium]|nr:hypothetical protein [Polyangia bacterium]
MRSSGLGVALAAGGLLIVSSCGGATSPGELGPVTTCAGTRATFPGVGALPAIASLPDPFQAMDGTRIARADQWACRTAEIGAQAQTYELGTKPAKPASVTGSFNGSNLTVNVSNGGKSISFTAAVTLPTTGTAPYPAMIGIGGISIGPATLNSLGVATIIFPNDTLAAQVDGGSRGMGA